MSNGDEVLDNWEEIDEVGLRNTLQKIQQKHQDTQQQQQIDSAKQCSKLPNTLLGGTITSFADPKQLTLSDVDFPTPAVAATVPMKLLQRNANSTTNPTIGGNASVTASGISVDAMDLKSSPLDDMTASFQPVMMLLNKPADEYQSTTYATPTNLQTVKILRRPTQSMEPRNNGIKPRQPIKTLQQREQEYAEARLRILGSAKNPEDDVGGTPNSSNSSTSSTNVTVNTIPSTNNTYKGSNASSPKVNQPGINGGVGSTGASGGGGGGGGYGNGSPLSLYNSSYNHNQQQQQQQQQQPTNYYYMQQQKLNQSLQKIPPTPAYNNRSMSALLPLPPLSTTLQQQHHAQSQTLQAAAAAPPPNQTWSPVVGGSVSSSALRQTQQQETILRLPRGPDGSAGFQMRR